jgi:hypothetical protein
VGRHYLFSSLYLPEVPMNTLTELQRSADDAAASIDINWEMLEQPEYGEIFTRTIEDGIANIPILESLYTKLTSGASVLYPDQPTQMPPDVAEECAELVSRELFSAYMIRAVYDKFTLINSITSYTSERDNGYH